MFTDNIQSENGRTKKHHWENLLILDVPCSHKRGLLKLFTLKDRIYGLKNYVWCAFNNRGRYFIFMYKILQIFSKKIPISKFYVFTQLGQDLLPILILPSWIICHIITPTNVPILWIPLILQLLKNIRKLFINWMFATAMTEPCSANLSQTNSPSQAANTHQQFAINQTFSSNNCRQTSSSFANSFILPPPPPPPQGNLMTAHVHYHFVSVLVDWHVHNWFPYSTSYQIGHLCLSAYIDHDLKNQSTIFWVPPKQTWGVDKQKKYACLSLITLSTNHSFSSFLGFSSYSWHAVLVADSCRQSGYLAVYSFGEKNSASNLTKNRWIWRVTIFCIYLLMGKIYIHRKCWYSK